MTCPKCSSELVQFETKQYRTNEKKKCTEEFKEVWVICSKNIADLQTDHHSTKPCRFAAIEKEFLRGV